MVGAAGEIFRIISSRMPENASEQHFLWNFNKTKFYKSRILQITWQEHMIFPKMIIGHNIIICVMFVLTIKILVNRHTFNDYWRLQEDFLEFLFLDCRETHPSSILWVCAWFWHNKVFQIKNITSHLTKSHNIS